RQGTSVWIHDRAEPASERLARTVAGHLTRVTGFATAEISRGPLRVLGALGAHGVACQAEISFLSDPVEQARLPHRPYTLRPAPPSRRPPRPHARRPPHPPIQSTSTGKCRSCLRSPA